MVLALIFSNITLVLAQRPEYNSSQSDFTLNEVEAIDAEIDAIHGEGFSANERNAHAQLELLYEIFGTGHRGEIIYPDFFGGTYIDESGNLVVLIVNTNHQRAQAYNAISTQLDPSVIYRFVDFSYNEMLATVEYISSIRRTMADNECVYARNVTAVGVRPFTNQVTVFLQVYNDSMIEGFRQYVYDSPMISFEQLNGITILDTSPPFRNYSDYSYHYLNSYWNNYYYQEASISTDERNSPLPPAAPFPGMGIRARAMQPPLTGSGSGTVGFRVRCPHMPWRRGFITTAHQNQFRLHNELVTRPAIGALSVGIISEQILNNTMDASLVTGAITSNTLPNGQQLSTSVTQPAFAGGVSMAGGSTGRIVGGSILNTNVWLDCACCNRFTFSGLRLTNIPVQPGDSGSTVFATANRLTSGIVLAGDSAHMVYLPAHRILSQFGLERY